MGLKSDRVVLVTGASRGAGKGIAIALGAAGATVYVTGRTLVEGTGDQGLPGTIGATAEAINEAGRERGGRGIALACDHRDNEAVAAVFQRIADDHGRLDILVNNAVALPPGVPGPRPFWEMPVEPEFGVIDVGVKSHYVAAWHAARMMVPAGSGLIAQVSSPGATTHLPGLHTPLYGAAKAGGDKLAFDMGEELRPHNVAVVALWPGLLRTERVEIGQAKAAAAAQRAADAGAPSTLSMSAQIFPRSESTQFVGRVIDAIAGWDDLMSITGTAQYAAELAEQFGVTDIDGSVLPSQRPWLGAPSSFPRVAPSYRAFREAGGVSLD